MKTRHYLITGIVTYLLFLIISIPAMVVTESLNEHIPQATITGTSGSIWNGSSQKINLASGQVIENANWSFCLWRLLTAELCINLDASYLDKPVQGQLGLGITGGTTARDLKAEIDAQTIGALANLPFGELGGLIFINLQSLVWAEKKISSANGKINWQNATITVAETAELGDVTINLVETNDFSVLATFSNKGGHIAVSGEGHISNDGNYNLELKLSPNTTASKNLRSSLEMFTKQQKDGSFVLKNTGNLKQIGIM